VRVSGPAGEVRFGYQTAIRLGAWELVLEAKLPRAYTFRAVVLHTHDYWSTQTPLDLVVAVGTTEWVWQGVLPKLEMGDRLVVEIGERPQVRERAMAQQRGAS